MAGIKLPSFDDAFKMSKSNHATPIDRFIYGNEPAGLADEKQFRKMLQAALDYAKAEGRKETEAESAAILKHAAKIAAAYTGSCPHDSFNFDHPKECQRVCGIVKPTDCWAEYFRSLETAEQAPDTLVKDYAAIGKRMMKKQKEQTQCEQK